MFAELVDSLVWIIRGALVAGLCWGAWLCLGLQSAAATPKPAGLERFATFALFVLLLSTVAGLIHAG